MSNNTLAREIFELFSANDHLYRFGNFSQDEDCIKELEINLSDPRMVNEIIEDIEEISDSFSHHEYYVNEVKPLLQGLREIQNKLELEQSKRMVSDTNYEVKHAIHIGDKEIVFAENKTAENGMCWFVGDYTSNDILGQYADCQVSDDYLEAMQEFAGRVTAQIEAVKSEIEQSKTPCELFTAEHCYPNDRSRSIDGKIVAIKADVFRPEYRRGDIQLVLVNGGNGASANSRGNAVFCYHLNDGKHTRFERYDVQGEVKPEYLPQWAKDKAAEIMAEKAELPQEKSKNREER